MSRSVTRRHVARSLLALACWVDPSVRTFGLGESPTPSLVVNFAPPPIDPERIFAALGFQASDMEPWKRDRGAGI